jgi:hypothetical protein
VSARLRGTDGSPLVLIPRVLCGGRSLQYQHHELNGSALDRRVVIRAAHGIPRRRRVGEERCVRRFASLVLLHADMPNISGIDTSRLRVRGGGVAEWRKCGWTSSCKRQSFAARPVIHWAAWRSRETLFPLGPSRRGRAAASQGELRSPRDRRAASCHEPYQGCDSGGGHQAGWEMRV